MRAQRNNLTRHPARVRMRVYSLHYDGRTAAEINADPLVAESVRKTGFRLHGNTLTRAFAGAEYKAFVRARETTLRETAADQITQDAIAEAGALASVTDVARYELAKAVRQMIANAADVGEVERLTRSLAAITRDETARLRAENEELKARIAELEVGSRAGSAGLSPETLQEVEEKVKLM